MTRESEAISKPLLMTQEQVARELGYRSNGSVRNLIEAGLLVGVKLNSTPNAAIRVTRESFERYYAEIVAEGLARFGPGAA